jgi:hypothetical protein
MARKHPPSPRPPTNPVAKFAARFNKAVVFQDKTRYSRKRKHKSREPFPIVLPCGAMGKGSRCTPCRSELVKPFAKARM